MAHLLSAAGVSARYAGQAGRALALVDVSLDVHEGERLLLLGPNGAGKSTFIRVAVGLMRPLRGEMLVAGVPARQARRLVGVVGHATYLYEELTAAENLRLYGSLYGVEAAEERGRALLKEAAVDRLADERVGRLSRGQQQRVAIARALMHNPPLLLLDEPDTGLDVAAFDVLERLTMGARRTLVFTTHNLAAGLRLGTRAAVLAGGRLVHQQERLDASDGAPLGDLLRELSGRAVAA